MQRHQGDELVVRARVGSRVRISPGEPVAALASGVLHQHTLPPPARTNPRQASAHARRRTMLTTIQTERSSPSVCVERMRRPTMERWEPERVARMPLAFLPALHIFTVYRSVPVSQPAPQIHDLATLAAASASDAAATGPIWSLAS